MQSVIETPNFVTSARRAGMTAAEREAVIDHLASNPMAGVVIPGAGGARKLRWRAEGRGKSSGYRVITYYAGEVVPVLLLDVFRKGDKADLSAAERAAVKAFLKGSD